MTWWLPWHPDWFVNVAVLLLAVVFDAMFPEPPNAIHPASSGWGRLSPLLNVLAMALAVPAHLLLERLLR